MKILILSALLACGLFHVSIAQSPVQLGAHANFNLNSARGTAFAGDKPDMLFGVGFGLDVRYKISAHFSLFAIPSIDQNGYAFRAFMIDPMPPTGGLQEADLLKRMMYINLPVVAAYTFGERTQFHLGAGAFVGWLGESRLVTKRSDGSTTSTSGSTSSNNEKDFNYGVTASAGAAFPLGKALSLNLSLQDNLGLANISGGSSTVKLNTFSVVTGLIYSFK